MTYLNNKNKVIENLILSKSSGWEYEQECRVIRASSRSYKFEREALTGICFGCKTSDTDMKTIMTLVNNVYSNQKMKFYKMELDNKSYQMNCFDL